MEATNDRAAAGKCRTSQDLDGLTADVVRDDVAHPGNGQLPCAGRPPGPAHSRLWRQLCSCIEHALDREPRGRRIISSFPIVGMGFESRAMKFR
jgi:hypothetical protein